MWEFDKIQRLDLTTLGQMFQAAGAAQGLEEPFAEPPGIDPNTPLGRLFNDPQGIPEHLWRAYLTYGQSGTGNDTITSFLQASKATHPDEQEVQDEYDLMLSAVRTGRNIDKAIAMAQSHLTAHRNALSPTNLNNPEKNPYVGEPEKNQQAIK